LGAFSKYRWSHQNLFSSASQPYHGLGKHGFLLRVMCGHADDKFQVGLLWFVVCDCLNSTYKPGIIKSALWYLFKSITYGQRELVAQCNTTRGMQLPIYSKFHEESVVLLAIIVLLPQKQTKSALWYLSPHIIFGQSELVVQYNTARGTHLSIYSRFHWESVVLLAKIVLLLKNRQKAHCDTYPHTSYLARVSRWFSVIPLEVHTCRFIASFMENLWCY
jgi:hypothetical protein